MPKKLVVVGADNKPTGVIQFKFEDGTEQAIDINALSDDIKFRLMVHGASQKIGDSYAGAKAEANPIKFAVDSVAETIKQLVEGNWRVTSPGGPRVTDLATVFAKVNGITIEEAVEFIGGLDEAQTKELRAKPRIKAELALLAAQRAAEKAAKAVADADKAEQTAA